MNKAVDLHQACGVKPLRSYPALRMTDRAQRMAPDTNTEEVPMFRRSTATAILPMVRAKDGKMLVFVRPIST